MGYNLVGYRCISQEVKAKNCLLWDASGTCYYCPFFHILSNGVCSLRPNEEKKFLLILEKLCPVFEYEFHAVVFDKNVKNALEAFIGRLIMNRKLHKINYQCIYMSRNWLPEIANLQSIIDLLKYDKKNNHGNINFVLLEKIGKPKIDCLVEDSIIIDAFEFYVS